MRKPVCGVVGVGARPELGELLLGLFCELSRYPFNNACGQGRLDDAGEP